MRKTVVLSVVACLALALVAAGCGKKGSGSGSGSGKRGAAGLVGTWAVDGEKTVAASEEFGKATPEQKKQIAEMMAKAEMKIGKDTMSMSGMGKEDSAKYKVLENKGDNVVIETEDDKGKKETIRIKYVSDDEIQGRGPKMVIVMKRKK